jgi:prevent-host-death family protein
MRAWQVQQAKARFSELIRQARTRGPQTITVRGHPAAVVLSKEAFERLQAPRVSLREFLRNSPLAGIEIARDKSPTRDVKPNPVDSLARHHRAAAPARECRSGETR